MAKQINEELDEKRRTQILEASLYCFLTFGYSKTSMDDVAQRARVSRPLIYVKFKNKEALLSGVFELLMEGRFDRAQAAAAGPGTKSSRLLAVCEILLVEPWSKVVGHPMSEEFYNICAMLLPAESEGYRHASIKCAQSIIGDKAAAEVFFLATEGLHTDLPTAKTLTKRLTILVERFAGRDSAK